MHSLFPLSPQFRKWRSGLLRSPNSHREYFLEFLPFDFFSIACLLCNSSGRFFNSHLSIRNVREAPALADQPFHIWPRCRPRSHRLPQCPHRLRVQSVRILGPRKSRRNGTNCSIGSGVAARLSIILQDVGTLMHQKRHLLSSVQLLIQRLAAAER